MKNSNHRLSNKDWENVKIRPARFTNQKRERRVREWNSLLLGQIAVKKYIYSSLEELRQLQYMLILIPKTFFFYIKRTGQKSSRIRFPHTRHHPQRKIQNPILPFTSHVYIHFFMKHIKNVFQCKKITELTGNRLGRSSCVFWKECLTLFELSGNLWKILNLVSRNSVSFWRRRT